MTENEQPTAAAPKRRGRPPKIKLTSEERELKHMLVDALDYASEQEEADKKKELIEQRVDEITYIPGDSDPVNTMIDFDATRPGSGLRFHANLPVKVKRTRTIKQLLVHKKTNADGNVVSIAVETDRPLVDVLRDNPKFSINGQPPAQQQTMVIRYDPDWYRGYAQKWIIMSTNLRTMNERWDQEKQMRVECGCNNDDELYLQPQLEYMRKRLTVDV